MDICTLSSRFIEPRVRYKGMKTFIIGRKAKKVYREVKMHVCYKKLREIKLFWRLRPVSKSNWHPSFKIDEIKIFLATKPIYVWKFSCLAVWNVSLENHIECTFFLIGNFVILSLQYTINSNPPGKETAFPVFWTSAVEKLQKSRILDFMKFLNVQQSRNFFGARRTYMVRAPSVTIELDNSTHARYHTIWGVIS